MPEHVCLHEAEIATLKADSGNLTQDMAEMRGDIKEILSCLKGNGGAGLMTRMALQERITGTRRDENTWLRRTIAAAAIMSFAYVLKDALVYFVSLF